MGKDNILIVVVVIIIAYFVLTSKTWIGTAKAAVSGISAIASDPCSGYAFNPVFYGICKLANPQTPAVTPEGTPSHTPQTPAPKTWVQSLADVGNWFIPAGTAPYGSDVSAPSRGYASAGAPGTVLQPDTSGAFDRDYYFSSETGQYELRESPLYYTETWE